MPPAAVLIIGLLEDLLSAVRPGLWGVGLRCGLCACRPPARNPAGLSGAAALDRFRGSHAFLAAMMAYVLTWVVYHQWPALAPLLLACVITVVLLSLDRLPVGLDPSSRGRRDARRVLGSTEWAVRKKAKSRHATFTRRTLLVSGGMTAVFGGSRGVSISCKSRTATFYLNPRRGQPQSISACWRRCADASSTASVSRSPPTAAITASSLVPEQTRAAWSKRSIALAKVIPIQRSMRARSSGCGGE